jgi:hypothetical protein
VISDLSKERGEKEEKTIRELKEMAKWSRSQQEMKTAINELSARGGVALPALEEILNVTAYEDIKAACIEAIKAVKGKKERKEEKEKEDDEEEKATVKKTKSEAQVVVEEEGEKVATSTTTTTTAGKTETVGMAS